MKLPSASAPAIRLWLATSLPVITTALVAIGGLGPYVPEIAEIGVSPHWVHVAGVIVAGIGALGFKLENPPLAVKQFLPWLYPVTPESLAAARERLVSPPAPVPTVVVRLPRPFEPSVRPATPEEIARGKPSEVDAHPGGESSPDPYKLPPQPPRAA